MRQTLSASIRRPNGLGGLFASFESLTAEVPPPADILVGFDAVVQCSRDLLQAAMVKSLNKNGLVTLAAQMPWDPSVASPKLRAAVATLFKFGGLFREHRLEVRLVGPHLVSLLWPPPPPPGSGGEVEETAAASSIRPRRVTVGWQFEVNLLVSGLPDTASQFSALQPPPPTGPVLSQDGGTGSGRSFNRVPIGKGQALTTAIADVRLVATRLQFGMVMAFSDEPPAVTSNDSLVSEFFASSLCQDLLAQSAAPLLSADRISLTPTIAPGGPLNADQVKPHQPATFKVRDVLLADVQGAPVLCLCLDIGRGSQGVLGLVQPFLDRADFGYVASMNLLGPALKARWSAVARGATFIKEVPVELPVSEDSDETTTGRARLHITLDRSLREAGIRAASGDLLRLVADQTIRLLALWDHRGKQITDLGPLADPQRTRFVLPLDLFAPAPPNTEGQPFSAFGEFIGKVVLFAVYPVLERFGVKGIAGYTSSPTQTLLSRWSLKGLLDDVRGPGGTTVKEDL